jgi:hypothetical protein
MGERALVFKFLPAGGQFHLDRLPKIMAETRSSKERRYSRFIRKIFTHIPCYGWTEAGGLLGFPNLKTREDLFQLKEIPSQF